MSSELDKFKRRMIRTMARLMVHEKQPADDVWDALRRDSGCDCKLLWTRMRALTIKKLDRLLAADDQPARLSAVVRLTNTDWLMCDLVLVHEDVDLIAITKPKCEEEPRPLVELFELVQSNGVEELAANVAKDPDGPRKLSGAWTAVTAYYNKTRFKGLRRQCSAMLMQRRWFQLKQSTRDAFYKLWHSYRGNPRLWDKVQDWQPTPLQTAIAKRFPHVITQPFQDWEQQITAGLVILPKEFEERVRNPPKEVPTQPSTSDGNDPDIEVLEPEIETIDLADSDSDEPNPDQTRNPSETTRQTADECSNELPGVMLNNDPHTGAGNEPQPTDGLSNVKILEATHIPIHDITNDTGLDNPGITIKTEPEDASDPAVKRRNLSMEMSKYMETTHGELDQDIAEDCINEQANWFLKNALAGIRRGQKSEVSEDVADDLIKAKADAYLGSKQVTEVADSPEEISDEMSPDDLIEEKTDDFLQRSKTSEDITRDNPTANEDSDEVDDLISNELIKYKADEYMRKSVQETFKKVVKPVREKTPSDEEEFFDDIIKHRADEFVRQADIKKLVSEVVSEVSPDPNENVQEVANEAGGDLLDGMEIVDDGIEYFEEGDECGNVNNTGGPQAESEDPKDAVPFDLKLLMHPVVYTLKLDHMAVFKHSAFDSVQDGAIIAKTLEESKPVSTIAINDMNNINEASNLRSTEGNIKLDQTLPEIDLISQEFYGRIDQKLPDNDESQEFNHSIGLNIPRKELPRQELYGQLHQDNDELYGTSHNDGDNDDGFPSDTESDNQISDDLKVKKSSYLLQKPRSRSYNPIQLCKNPDFNTRLKRLTVGFFSSSRNRQLIKACKPMTIDLHKAFESKLINGTIYLKAGDVSHRHVDTNQTEQTHSASVMPSAMPIQSLINSAMQNYVPNTAPVSTVDLTSEKDERNKVINLKDINEIRRINQKLQTAQVTPIRVHTEASETALTPDTVTLQEDENEANAPNDPNLTTSSENTPVSKAAKLLQKEKRLKTKLLSTKEILSKRKAAQKPIRKPGGYFYSNELGGPVQLCRKAVSWSKPVLMTPKVDEFLITIDTLNKMVNKMNGIDEPYKTKNKNWLVNSEKYDTKHSYKYKNKNQNSDNDEYKIKPEITDDEKNSSETLNAEERLKPPTKIKPKTTIIAAGNQPSSSSTYCCWAREKLIKAPQGLRVRKAHRCKRRCECCCCDDLLQMYNSTPEKRRLLAGNPSLRPYIQGRSKVQRVMVPVPPDAPAARRSTPEDNGALLPIRGTPMEVSAVTDAAYKEFIKVTSQETSTRIVLQDPPEYFYIAPPRCNIATADKAIQADLDTPADTPINEATHTGELPQPYPNNQRQIVLDGSISTPQIPKTLVDIPSMPSTSNANDKMVYLSSKSISKEPNNSPIYLGKNKILLTNVKFPSSSGTSASPKKIMAVQPIPGSSPVKPAAMLPSAGLSPIKSLAVAGGVASSVTPLSLSLPAGVQLVLPPHGELTYILEPGVVLDALQLDTLAAIIQAIKEQMIIKIPDDGNDHNNQTESDSTGACQITTLTNEPDVQLTNIQACSESDVTQSIIEPAVIQSTIEPEVTQTTSEPTTTTVETQIASGANSIAEVETAGSNTTATVEPDVTNIKPIDSTNQSEIVDLNSDSDTDGQEISTRAKIPQEIAEESSSRNLLSDLMEMSGISAEDIRPTPKEVSPIKVTNANTILPVSPTNLNATNPVPVINVCIPPPEPNSNLANLPELSPVTSLAELKYACEQNGKFFKLDFETGVLLPINVCIKRNPKVKKTPVFYVSNTPKPVIDLTDDANEQDDQEDPQKDVSMNYKLPTLTRLPSNAAMKSLSLVQPTNKVPRRFKIKSPAVPNKPRHYKIYTGFQGEYKRSLRQTPQRKASSNRIEAKIDMVDSDAPLEEEYLVDSESDDDEFRPPAYVMNKIRMQFSESVTEIDVPSPSSRSLLKPQFKRTVEPDLDEVSSDDEPLAKKVKKGKKRGPKSKAGSVVASRDVEFEDTAQATPVEEQLPAVEDSLSAVEDPASAPENQRLAPEDQGSAPEDHGSAAEDQGSAAEDQGSGAEDCDMEIDETVPAPFFADDEEQEDDCILGV